MAALAAGCALAAVGAGGYLYYQQQHHRAGASAEPKPMTALESAEAKRAATGSRVDAATEALDQAWKHMDRLTEEEAAAVLRQNQQHWRDAHSTGMDIYTDQVASNPRIEDYATWMPLGVGTEEGLDRPTRIMFGVFDGHSGHQCAEQLALRLGPKLDELLKNNNGLAKDAVPAALAEAFTRMDHELVYEAAEKYRSAPSEGGMDELLAPALAGSCGVVAVVDTEAREVTVANVGDSRAVLGMRLPDGRWRAVPLSVDQTARNPLEAERVRAEHPGEPRALKYNRIVGNLMPSRAFGDCRYKWSLETQGELFPGMAARGYSWATTHKNCITPPYVTAAPDVITHRLGEGDKFVVLATDGVFDELTNDEVVNVVGEWYDAKTGKVPSGAVGAVAGPREDNAAAHLIRAALCNNPHDPEYTSVWIKELSRPAPHSRRYRDDMTAVVVMLDQDSSKDHRTLP
ncbi:[Pyruvate dehydrogenase [acetyl-transferring]]-phosphatase 1, mitochondrial [Coemansia javaensis]|uniref:[Pyruvate dehydrogenase [acetyl-transferring]]-phosphatase 1, mitochondrial n=1 Tax=Coemansia javaensis TaxID=2761396 RepID=A0A9W8HEF8_9FUNG|nr:[Pyruvate dehydrogenase [acetyl-transferring]]-phosphatase 1, mitochondrial [Coemansia javaensis]